MLFKINVEIFYRQTLVYGIGIVFNRLEQLEYTCALVNINFQPYFV